MSAVFVSGANGYIAQHIVLQLIAKGYKVIGSVRSHEKGQALVQKLKSDKFEYVIISDLTKENEFDEALKAHPEVEGFIHTASPVTFTVTDYEKDMIEPAIKGTEAALNAAKKYGIKRFVYTSSFAAILSEDDTKDSVLTEETWNPLPRDGAQHVFSAYQISKKFSEKAVWDFSEKESKPTINIVSPNMVFGPQAFDSDVKETMNFSVEIINSLLKLKPDDDIPPHIPSGFIDVRDVAKAHIFALETESTNLRLLCSEERYTTQLIMDLIHKNFPELNHLPVGKPGSGSDFSIFPLIANTKSKDLAGPFRSLETSVVDTVKQILRTQK